MSTETYQPLTFPADSTLTAKERECVEIQRRGLWEEGVRKEPLLTEMAFSFAAALSAQKASP